MEIEDANKMCRMDLVWSPISVDQDGTILFEVKPDPKRYDWVELGGKEYLKDRFESTFFEKEEVARMLLQLEGMDMHYTPPPVGSLDDIAFGAAKELDRIVNSDQTEREEKQAVALISAVSIDIVDSTGLHHRLGTSKYARMFHALWTGFCSIASAYKGYPMKATGDGGYFLFSGMTFANCNDFAFQFALAARLFILKSERNLSDYVGEAITVRIGVDSGDCRVISLLGLDDRKFHEVVGLPLHLAKKAEQKGMPMDIVVGHHCARNLHCSLREMLEAHITIPYPADKPLSLKSDYELFKVSR